ncbi:unnamed protein product [Protopolystoma xenopodis]|uniref:Uncharacterized protein n=1 Tax=Protopolystoma xenopodis TaxID=117903 RepID=A0A3S5CE64_9PLAT|nr:unnamed protein product [Protopolystoma xenopodis]
MKGDDTEADATICTSIRSGFLHQPLLSTASFESPFKNESSTNLDADQTIATSKLTRIAGPVKSASSVIALGTLSIRPNGQLPPGGRFPPSKGLIELLNLPHYAPLAQSVSDLVQGTNASLGRVLELNRSMPDLSRLLLHGQSGSEAASNQPSESDACQVSSILAKSDLKHRSTTPLKHLQRNHLLDMHPFGSFFGGAKKKQNKGGLFLSRKRHRQVINDDNYKDAYINI